MIAHMCVAKVKEKKKNTNETHIQIVYVFPGVWCECVVTGALNVYVRGW